MAGKQQNTNVPSVQTPQPPGGQPPAMSEAEKEFQQFLARIKILLNLGQMTSALRADPQMAQLLGPQVYNGLLASLQGQSTATVRQLLGPSNMDYIDRASHGSQDEAARLMTQAAEGQQKVNERYRQMRDRYQQTQMNTMHPSKQQAPAWMSPQAWQNIQQTQPWYAQASLLGMTPQGGFGPTQASVPTLSQHEMARILQNQGTSEAFPTFDAAVKRNVMDTRNLSGNDLHPADQAIADKYRHKFQQGDVNP